jgi:hypothetical protein
MDLYHCVTLCVAIVALAVVLVVAAIYDRLG